MQRLPLSASLALLVLLAPLAAAAEKLTKVDFQRDIRPILADKCLKCHGPDEESNDSELRLDNREHAFTAIDGHHALVAGKPQQSQLYLRISAKDADKRMPPADSGKELSAAEIELFRRWIEQGAEWTQHWAFVAPVRPLVPTQFQSPQAKEWIKNPIDAFVLAHLEQQGLAPSPPAEKATLLRRVSLDLTGLPPTLEELNNYLADDRPDAWQRQVERLLKSPHYGERWGRHWLDAARYADSDGFEKDKPRFVWFYRDWVINAFNRDLPYDQFIVEQIAGDLLPGATQDQQVATGFLRNSMINEEGGIDPEQFRMEAMFDRMDAIGKAILGLTIQCTQCHNHKYDPLTQLGYYRMFAFINNCDETAMTVYTHRELAERNRVLDAIRKLEDQLKQATPDWQQRLAAWEAQQRKTPQPEWQVAKLEFDDKTIGGQKFLPRDDGSYCSAGYAPTKFRPKMTLKTPLKQITAIRLELLTDPNLPRSGPGRSIYGTCALTEFEVEAASADQPEKFAQAKVAEATADLNLPEEEIPAIYHDKDKKKRFTGPISFAIDGKQETAWGIDIGPGRRNQPRKAVFRLEQPISHEQGSVLNIYLTQKHGGWNSDDNQTYNLGRFRISLTSAEMPQADPLPAEVRRILSVPAEKRTPAEAAAVFSYWRTTVPEWQEANARIEALWKEHPQGTTQLVLHERAKMRATHRLERGDFLNPQERVTPGVPELLHPLPKDAPLNRLTFARWLVDRKSPTTARTMVNRIWQAYFGRGLVETAEDLGLQSSAPTHPQLLDWLAVEFMDNGWSFKHLHRLIVTSKTYRQSSQVTPELLERDPYNKHLARGPRYRVEAEVVRDIALAASGLLNQEVGGASVYPPAPEFLFKPPASYGPKTWNTEKDAEKYRRAVYTFRFRSVPYPVLDTFDAPNADQACVRRARSNTPLQALTTLNEPLFVECAQALALRTVKDGGKTDADRLAYAFRRCTARTPSEQESAVLLGLLKKQTERFGDGKQNPWELAVPDPQHPPALPEGTTPAELAAWTVVSRVLLNLDETITKE